MKWWSGVGNWPVTAGFKPSAGTWPATADKGTGAGKPMGVGPGSAVVGSVGWTGMTKGISSLAAVKSAVEAIVRARCPRSGHCQDGMAIAFLLVASWKARRLV